MTSRRLISALAVSLLVHALLVMPFARAPAAARRDPVPLEATLVIASGGAEALPAPPEAVGAHRSMPRIESGDARVNEAVRAEVLAPVAAAPQPENAPPAEPGSVMSLPHQGQIRYALYRDGHLIGHRLEEWRHDGNTYAIERRTDLIAPAGRALAQSRGVVSADGFVPLAFQDEASGEAVRELVQFNWQALRVTITVDGAPPRELGLETGTQDALSLPYEIGQAVLHGKRLTAAIASGGGILQRDFEVVGEEQTAVGGRLLRVLHLRSRAADPDAGPPELDLWLGIDEQYLPLRIRRADGTGRELDQVAENVSY